VPAPALPDWARRAAAAEPRPSRPLAPSRLPPEGMAEPAPVSPRSGDTTRRFQRGSLIHRLLETLPEITPEMRRDAATRYLALPAHGLDKAAREEIADAVFRVLNDRKFAAIFAPGSRAEAPVAGMIDFGGVPFPVTGQIDRLCIADDAVMIVDYKTNRPPPASLPEVAPAYVAQMAAYRAVLARIYPGRQVRCALLWTDGPTLMELPAEMLDNALKPVASATKRAP